MAIHAFCLRIATHGASQLRGACTRPVRKADLLDDGLSLDKQAAAEAGRPACFARCQPLLQQKKQRTANPTVRLEQLAATQTQVGARAQLLLPLLHRQPTAAITSFHPFCRPASSIDRQFGIHGEPRQRNDDPPGPLHYTLFCLGHVQWCLMWGLLRCFRGLFAKKSQSRLSVKRRLWLVNQVTTDASLPTVRICRLFYRSDAIQIHLILYLLIDYVYRHSTVQQSLSCLLCLENRFSVSPLYMPLETVKADLVMGNTATRLEKKLELDELVRAHSSSTRTGSILRTSPSRACFYGS